MFFRYEALFQRIYHLQIHPVEGLDLLAVGIEIRIGLANQILNRCAVCVGHGLINEREASLAIFGKDKVRIDVDNLPEEYPLLLQCFLSTFDLGDVDGGTDVTEERAVGCKTWHAMIQDPAIFTVKSSQAVFHGKLLPRVEVVSIDFKTAVEVFWVNTLCPPVAEFLLQGPAGKVEPTFVEKNTELVRARHPDHHGCRIGHGAEALLTLSQRFVGRLALRDVNGHATQPKRTALAVK